MSLERKDIRAKLAPEMYAALAVLADVDKVDMGEWIERELVRVIEDRLHAASLIADAMVRLGISGNRREQPGKSGSGRE
jgi:hypothetical protein